MGNIIVGLIPHCIYHQSAKYCVCSFSAFCPNIAGIWEFHFGAKPQLRQVFASLSVLRNNIDSSTSFLMCLSCIYVINFSLNILINMENVTLKFVRISSCDNKPLQSMGPPQLNAL